MPGPLRAPCSWERPDRGLLGLALSGVWGGIIATSEGAHVGCAQLCIVLVTPCLMT